MVEPLRERVLGRVLVEDVYNPETNEVIDTLKIPYWMKI